MIAPVQKIALIYAEAPVSRADTTKSQGKKTLADPEATCERADARPFRSYTRAQGRGIRVCGLAQPCRPRGLYVLLTNRQWR